MSTLRKTTFVLLAVCVAAVFVMGCKSAPPPTAPTPAGTALVKPPVEQPAWVDDPEGAFPGDRGKVIYAVGVSEDALNRSMTRQRAIANGRNELARVLKVHVASMMKDWMATSTDYVKPENTTSKQFTESVSRQVTNALLVGSKTVKYWTAPDKAGYALMSLSRDDPFFKAIAEQSKQALQKMERDEQEKVLKVRMEDAMKSLDSYLGKQQAAK